MTKTAFSLELNEEERNLLQEILEARHRMLLREISHTDHHEYRVGLKKKAELLESVLGRLTVHA